MIDLEYLHARLPGRRIEWHSSVDSTMLVAARLIGEGCPTGTIVGTEEQTAGIGRYGHSWHSAAGAGLYVSIILDRVRDDAAVPPLMLALGLATRQAMGAVSGLVADLRWPNDVLLNGRKCAGVLAQLEAGCVIAGIGINVSHEKFPAEIALLATSLKQAGTDSVSREDLLVALADGVDEYISLLRDQGPAAVIDAFKRASSYALGRRVRVYLGHREVEGVTRGLDASGFLLVRDDHGHDTTILAGGVRPA